MRILIVEDNEKLSKSLKKGLEQEGFVADCLADGESAEKRLMSADHTYDAVVLDLMLPKKDGLAVCRAVRAAGVSTPILMLTAKDTVPDRITGLRTGADDYLVKPFAFDELVARLQALVRRPSAMYSESLRAGDVTLDVPSRRISKSGREVKLTDKEFVILLYLMRNQGRVVSRQDILDHAWDYDFTTFSNLVDVKIKNIRKKIDPKGEIIETIRNAGYRLNP